MAGLRTKHELVTTYVLKRIATFSEMWILALIGHSAIERDGLSMFPEKKTNPAHKFFVKIAKPSIFTALLYCLPLLLQATSPFLPPSFGNPGGDLRIEIVTAYNLIVDSNVESPSSYAPEAFHAGVKFCNDGTDTLWNVQAYIGNFAANTPGIYPSRTHSGLTGTFSFTHEGGSAGTADASRFIRFIPPGKCVVQYWLISYPNLDDNGNSVTQGNGPADDLWLNFDVWATADDNGTPLAANDTQTLYMRSEISASANKIWPNGDNKVPLVYKQAIQESLGWDIEADAAGGSYPGETFAMQGIWYDLGNVGAGFDNDGDLVPDRNAWLQPVGDAAFFDANCYRLVSVFGLVIVKLNDGTEKLIPFQDQLYFENLPENNTGAVGLVFYRFASLNTGCTAALTPYQEVASGFDNEKFNGDYGRSIALPVVLGPQVVFSKNVDKNKLTGAPSETLTYTLTISNTGAKSIGDPLQGIPLVIEDPIPAGTTYVAGSAAAGNVLPTGVSVYSILYSTNNGTSWTNVEPVPASSVNRLRWQLEGPLLPGASGSVTFQVTVSGASANPSTCNTGYVRLGTAAPFLSDDACTLGTGSNSIGDLVWNDNGGTTGIGGNGIKDGNEAVAANAEVRLYFDLDGNGLADSTDILWGKDTTDVSGNYLFSQLPDGKFVVQVCDTCTVNGFSFSGWGSTTAKYFAVALDTLHATSGAVASLTNDFGFATAPKITKVLNTGTPEYEGQTVSYTLNVSNVLPPPANSQCVQTAWATGISSSSFCNNPTNATGAPNGVYAAGTKWNNFTLGGNGFTFPNPTGSIAKVELIFQFYHSQPILNETMFAEFQLAGGSTYTTPGLTVNEINEYVGINNVHYVVFDVTSAQAWTWSNFTPTWYSMLKLVKTTSGDGSVPYVDAIGVRVTPANCSESLAYDPDITLNPVPVTDDYDPARLEFESASPPPDVVNTTTGLLTWNNVGPINGQTSKFITVNFKAKEPGNLVSGDSTVNVANVNNAYFANGDPASNSTSSSGVRIVRSGSIAGFVWSDTNANGWQSPNGYQSGEPFIPNVKMVLHTCTAVHTSNGSCTGTLTTDTIRTNSSGAYLFEGLQPNLFYKVELIPSSIPGTTSQTGDPDDDPVNGTGNGGTCGSGGGNASCDATWNRNNNWFKPGTHTWAGQSWDVTNINFGYTNQRAMYGQVWRDYDGDGLKETGETGISSVTMELRNGVCVPGSTCPTTTTDASGNYTFSNLAAGTYTVVVRTNTLPSGMTWTETAETDGTINNQITVTPAAGVISGSHNFGFQATGTASVGDVLYYDWDSDGVKDANEEGIPGISMHLYIDYNNNGEYDDGADIYRASTVTNSSGGYLFSNLPPGNYVVRVDENDPDFPGSPSQTADPEYPGVTCITCDGVGKAVLTTAALLTVDFGYQPTGDASVGNAVWYDANGDGIKSGVKETGIASVTVQLWVDFNGDGTYSLLSTQVSDASGNYTFDNLPDGNYRIVIDSTDADLPNDALGNRVKPTTSSFYNAIIDGGAVTSLNGVACTGCDQNADFGFVKKAIVGDFLFWDANQNGLQDWTETGIPNVTVKIFDETNTLIATTVTSNGSGGYPAGFYSFANLEPGDYYIVVDSLDADLNGATLLSDPSADGVPCTDPSAIGCDHRYSFSLSYDAFFAGVDFGYLPKGVIADFVWLDSDNDGVQDFGEPGLSNIQVQITNQTTVTIGATTYPPGAYTSSVYTDADGYYTFSTLPDGSWTVQVIPGGAYTATYDADGGLNNSTTAVISSGIISNAGNAWCPDADCSLDVDFGLKLNGSNTVSGTVCLDDGSGDGTCSTGGETKLDSLVVRIYSSGGMLVGTTLTDVNGNYSFPGLPNDTYSVVIGTTQPPLHLTALTTTAGVTPATSITTNARSIVQTVPVSSSTSGVDFAFVINVDLDFGDLPNGYPVLLGDGPAGAYHILPTTPALFLGATVDAEADGSKTTQADGDDNSGDDENGVVFNDPASWTVGTAGSGNGGSVSVTVQGTGWLVGWIDFNKNQSFVETGDMIVSQAVTTGTYNISFDIPAGTDLNDPDYFYARFRLFQSEPGFPRFAYSDQSSNGEVEDYSFLTFNCPSINAGTAVANDSICLEGSGLMTINLFDKITGEDSGGDWTVISGTPGSNFNAGAGTLNPNGLPIDTYIFRYTISGTPPCADDSEDWTITIYRCCPPQICLPVTTIRN
jgi:uncharacterized repeat protein (TIGR01451 family)